MSHAIKLQGVTKIFPLYHLINSGIKDLLIHPKSLIDFFKSRHFVAIKDISFEIKKGEAVAIIGKNGSGKSTLLSLISGILKPSQGQIQTRGKISSILELGGGFHPDLSGLENIRLNAILLGLTRHEVDHCMDSIIQFSELGSFINQPIRIYSSGMLAKLGFSVIINTKPDILIIDEILSVGDVDFQKKCTVAINSLIKKGVTTILVSHNMNDVRQFCTKAIWIENKGIKKIGDTNEVVNAYIKSFD